MLCPLTDPLHPQFYLKQRTDHPDFLDGDLSGDETGLNGALGPSEGDAERWSWWGGGFDDTETGSNGATATLAALGSLPTQVGGALASMLDASDPDAVRAPSATPFPTLQGDGVSDDDMMRMGLAANEWMAFVVVTVGSFLLIGSCLAYWRAWRCVLASLCFPRTQADGLSSAGTHARSGTGRAPV